MDKISVSKIVDFQRLKSENSKVTFLKNLSKPKPEKKEGEKDGGNHWVHSLSTIGSTFVTEDNQRILDKIDIVDKKLTKATAKTAKQMFQRNIDILYNFQDYDFADLKPNSKVEYLSKPRDKSILNIHGVPVQILPQHVFTFDRGNNKNVGAVWFVSKLDGYKIAELGTFTDALYRYLHLNYASVFIISREFCTAIDVTNLNEVNYEEVYNQSVPSILESTLTSIKNLVA